VLRRLLKGTWAECPNKNLNIKLKILLGLKKFPTSEKEELVNTFGTDGGKTVWMNKESTYKSGFSISRE
jgi:hypothetical protein